MTWERKILRNKYGPSHDKRYWRIKINQEIYNKFKSPNSVTEIKIHILEWLGHVLRVGSIRAAKKLPGGKTGEGRKKNNSFNGHG
jgi:hypothetical protein